MGFTDEQMTRIKEVFSSCARPLILFDDDPDGLSSFLMVYDHIREGKGIPIKNAPEIGPDLARTVNDYSPDLVIILDMPIVSQDFLDEVTAKVIWLDHHQPIKRKGVEYYNPMVADPLDERPTSYWVYRILGKKLWVAMTGMVGDWFMPEEEIRKKFISSYPGLLPEDILKPEVALHDSRLGTLVQIIAYNLKGKGSDVVKSVKIFTRIKDPFEILDATTPAGKFVFKKYAKLKEDYDKLIKEVKVTQEDKLILFVYKNDSYSFSSEISNELIYRHPGKVVLVAWEYGGEYKCSLRSTNTDLPKLIEKSLDGVTGYGGGHEHASGACIKVADFDRFVENIRKILG